MAEYKCGTKEALFTLSEDIKNNSNYKKVMRFGNEEQIDFMNKCTQAIANNLQKAAAEKQREAEEHRKSLEEAMESLEGNYIKVRCSYCGEKLEFPEWMIEMGETLCCPLCEREFRIAWNNAEAHGNCD